MSLKVRTLRVQTFSGTAAAVMTAFNAWTAASGAERTLHAVEVSSAGADVVILIFYVE